MDCLAYFGVGGAHPGGLYLTEQALLAEKITSDSTVLDVGCGTGQTAAFLAEKFRCQVTGIDLHPIMVEKARQRFKKSSLSVDVMEGNVENLPFASGMFDYVLSESVLSFTNIPLSLREISRVLKRGGVLIAVEAVLEQPADVSWIKEFYGFTGILTVDEWQQHFHSVGLNKVEIWKEEPPFNVKSAPDFSPSTNIDPALYDILDKHHQYLQEYKELLGYRIFRCSKG